VGSLFGNVVFGWIADKWGRRTAFFAILFLEVIFSIATSFSPNYVIYTALRTVNGLFFPAIYQIPFILGTLDTLGTSSKSQTTPKFQGEGERTILLKYRRAFERPNVFSPRNVFPRQKTEAHPARRHLISS